MVNPAKSLTCLQSYQVFEIIGTRSLVRGHFWSINRATSNNHKRKDALRVFLSNAGVAMDTNHEERALRVIPMGRRNYLFCWTELGATCVGRIQSLLVTCKLHGINPYTYLVDVLQRIQSHPIRDVSQLTPRLLIFSLEGAFCGRPDTILT